MAIGIDKGLGIHPHALLAREARATVLASNIANADTPGYKAKDINFQDALQRVQSRSGYSMSRTHSKHFELDLQANNREQYRVPDQPDTGDGNTVDVQVERNLYMRNSMEYQASLQFLNDRISGMKKAITGGR
ncbi:flagellar basal body rod protein FlgB [Aliidiomarina sedimenti]|uniref:Flagellar basal body rod protein FlgB n=2 Tax=Aliidiomarina TaxID=1249554 RepID=A0A432WCT7_9GAMM|nr:MULTISPECIES: flagellar basal body rod protein FlgB [Aliidiomarina]RUO29880.1 flagellar basal body rod protein FlgB [Aliidiomarina sedimenti]RUO30219.1 flagellar basal body rod protein FlgB [Aliidiomarina soli]